MVAGPVEAAALSGGLAELRALLRETQHVVRYELAPTAEGVWASAEHRVG